MGKVKPFRHKMNLIRMIKSANDETSSELTELQEIFQFAFLGEASCKCAPARQ